MPLNVRCAVGCAGRAGSGAVAVVIARSVVAAPRSGGTARPLRVAVLGAGNVGREVVRSLLSGWEGPRFDLVGVAVRDIPKAEAAGMPAALLTDAPAHLVANNVDLIVELMGGEEPARTLM